MAEEKEWYKQPQGWQGDTQEYKIVVLGGGGVGKSALTIRLVTNNFLEEYDPTIEDSYRKSVVIDEKACLLDLLDTAGQEEFSSMQDQWMREGQAFLVVYSITSRTTFDEAIIMREKINRCKLGEEPPIILVGNKCDLEDQRQVQLSEGQGLANKWGENSSFFETSAKEKLNHEECFYQAVRLIREHKIRQSDITTKKMKKSIPAISCNCCNCDCSKIGSIVTWCKSIKYEEKNIKYHTDNDKISFFKTGREPLPDIVPAPIYSLKNFDVKRKFYFTRFIVAILCGVLLPLIIIFQTIAFLIYREDRKVKYYPQFYPYERIHKSIFFDFLGFVIGRKPGQDPETVKDAKWFLRQTRMQLLQRVIISFIILLISLICCYNLSQVGNEQLRVSLMETAGPFILYWIVWILLSLWIAYEIELTPDLPSTLRLRSVILYLGEKFKHRTSVYRFLRAYSASRDKKWKLGIFASIVIIILGLLYASVPGIIRLTVGDTSDGLWRKKFITKKEAIVEVGALVANFALVFSFIYAIEVQYRKHFDNYKEWMYDITMLLHKDNANDDTDSETHYKLKKGKNFSKNIFLSLTRRSNALGWLEIRQFLAVEGKILFAEQELPTLWMLILTISLALFMLYRAYFIGGAPLQSILFNGCIILSFICFLSLIRITIVGYKFDVLQAIQLRLLGEQKFFMRCYKQNSDEIQRIKSKGLRDLMTKTHQKRYRAPTLTDLDEMLKDMEQKNIKKTESKLQTIIELANTVDNKEEEEYHLIVNKNEIEDGHVSVNGDSNSDSESHGQDKQHEKTGKAAVISNEEIKEENYEAYFDEDNDESAPLLGGTAESNAFLIVKNDISQMKWYSHNVGFIDDVLYIVQAKDIYPRLFGVKLNSVLAKAIAGIVVSALATMLRICLK